MFLLRAPFRCWLRAAGYLTFQNVTASISLTITAMLSYSRPSFGFLWAGERYSNGSRDHPVILAITYQSLQGIFPLPFK